MTYYGETNIGKICKNNEDAFIAQTMWNDTHMLCAAIDGIDGNYGGADRKHGCSVRLVK